MHGEQKDGSSCDMSELIQTSIRAMARDELKYPEPSRFYPERYLNEDGSMNPTAPDPGDVVFGFGRRICPGRHLANASIFLAVASILSTFKIKEAYDDRGQVLKARVEYTPGLVRLVLIAYSGETAGSNFLQLPVTIPV